MSSFHAHDPGDGQGPAGQPRRPAVSGAGRDLPAAILVGLALGAAILVSLLLVRHAFIGVVAVCVAVATYEFAGALRSGAGIRIPLLPALLGGQAIVWSSWPLGFDGMLAAFVGTALACLVWRVAGGADGFVRDTAASLLAVTYIPLLASFAALLVVPADGVARVVCFFLAVIASDVGGYAAGALGGRHPMAPSISPKKTWEGLAGSLAVGIGSGAATVSLLLGGQYWHGVIFGAAIAVTATLGDLIESLIKRDIGVKDMGSLLPGHGGLMDRMDSLLPAAVVSWLLLSVFV